MRTVLQDALVDRWRAALWAGIAVFVVLAAVVLGRWGATADVLEVRSGGVRALAGRISDVDGERFVIRLGDGGLRASGEQIAILRTTVIRVGEKEGGLGDLDVGLPVAVVAVEEAGRWVARSIVVGVEPSRQEVAALLRPDGGAELAGGTETAAPPVLPRVDRPRSAPPPPVAARAEAVPRPHVSRRGGTGEDPVTRAAEIRRPSPRAAPDDGAAAAAGSRPESPAIMAALPRSGPEAVVERAPPAPAPATLAPAAPVYLALSDGPRRDLLGYWYRLRADGSPGPSEWRFQGTETCGAGTCYVLTANGVPAMVVTDTGAVVEIRDPDGRAVTYNPPVPVVPAPVGVGARWSQRTRVAGPFGTRTVTFAGEIVDRQSVRTPAGIFPAFRVRFFEDWQLVREFWFTPKVPAPLRVQTHLPDGPGALTLLVEHDRGPEPVVQARLDKLFEALGRISDGRRTGRITADEAERLKSEAFSALFPPNPAR